MKWFRARDGSFLEALEPKKTSTNVFRMIRADTTLVCVLRDGVLTPFRVCKPVRQFLITEVLIGSKS